MLRVGLLRERKEAQRLNLPSVQPKISLLNAAELLGRARNAHESCPAIRAVWKMRRARHAPLLCPSSLGQCLGQCKRADSPLHAPFSNSTLAPMLDLQGLVAQSRRAALEGAGAGALPLAALAAHMQGLLASVSAAQHDEDSPEQLQRATELTLGFRALRNAAAAGGGGDAVVAAGVLPLAAAALDALANATITLDWQLPAAVAQALANLCNAGASAAAAAWAALFPLRFTLLAHVNTGAVLWYGVGWVAGCACDGEGS